MISDALPSPMNLPFDQPDLAVRVALDLIAKLGTDALSGGYGEMIAMTFTNSAKREEYFTKLDAELQARGIVLTKRKSQLELEAEARINAYLEKESHGVQGRDIP